MATNSVLKTTSASELQKMQSNIDTATTSLRQSPTAYAGIADPTKSDLALEVRLNAIKATRDKAVNDNLKKSWYGDTSTTENTKVEEPKGVLDYVGLGLSAPLYGVVGAAKYVAGKSSSSDIFSSMAKNVDTDRETWGSLLRQFGAPAPVSAPVGFALDVATDPFNWLSIGSTGLIGKTAIGAKEAGTEGVLAGLRSGVLSGTSKFLDIIPGLSKKKEIGKYVMEMAEKTGLDASHPDVRNGIIDILTNSSKKVAQAKVGLEKLVSEKSAWETALKTAATGSEEAANAARNLESVTAKIEKATATAAKLARPMTTAEALKSGSAAGLNLPGKIRVGAFKLGEKAAEATKKWEGLTGYTPEFVLEKKNNKVFTTDTIRNWLGETPNGQKLLDLFDYNPRWYQEAARLKQTVLNIAKQSEDGESIFLKDLFKGNPEKTKEVYDAFLRERRLAIENKIFADAPAIIARGNKSEVLKATDNIIQDAADIALNPTAFPKSGTTEAYAKMLGTVEETNAFNKYLAIIKKESLNETGVKWIDDIDKSIRAKKINWKGQEIKYGEKVLDAYGNFINMFKKLKLGILSPSSMTYAAVGNLSMAHLMGLDLTNGRYFSSVADALKLYRGGADALAVNTRILNNPIIRNYLEENPFLFKNMSGINASEFFAHDLINESVEYTKNAMEHTAEHMNDAKAAEQMVDTYKENAAKFKADTRKSTTSERIIGGATGRTVELTPFEQTTSSIFNETMTPAFVQFSKDVKAKADAGSRFFKVLNGALEKSKSYEVIDQSYKLGTFLHLVENGITPRELNIISRSVKVNPATDLLSKYTVGANTYYKLNPDKAIEIANIMYMNYAALPEAVKVIRQLPVLGAPFFSFPFLMAAKTGETLVHNPGALNKINFLMKELESERGPLERENLNSKYYSWYKKPGIMSISYLPWMKENPLYLNLIPAIPTLGMNMFNPSERSYGATMPDQIASLADKLPFFQDPVGQVIKDTIVMPALIRDYAPQNQFGGPLYPSDATAVEKAGYGLRTAAEALTPSGLGLLGPIASGLPDQAINMLPSYNLRKGAYAWKGKTPLGITSSEPTWSRGMRSLLSTIGVNVQPMDTDYLSNQIKKQIKQ